MKPNFVKIIAYISVLATILWSIGLFLTVNDQLFTASTSIPSPSEPTPVASETEDIHIVAIGDSLTRGTGDTSGSGYVSYMLEELSTKSEQQLHLSNLAIKGYTSQQLLGQLEQTEVQRQLQQADIILMTIGGNDLFQGGESILNFSDSDVDASQDDYRKNLQNIYTTLHNLNEEATLFHIGLYNPFSALDDSALTSSVVRQWNFETAELASSTQNIVVVPTFDLFQLDVKNYLYSDQFHPNSAGYRLIGERVASLITFSEGETEDE
ncbi:SGNH/GDSL hydrolase family protein [Bacillus sp. 2205SS5-2]|uniref:SGNH/GDSL hydrolase family protein n=1 Tax=Bacillus sp. 2205SS5-2 TaxID=3109031 RepID=UPI0030040D28